VAQGQNSRILLVIHLRILNPGFRNLDPVTFFDVIYTSSSLYSPAGSTVLCRRLRSLIASSCEMLLTDISFSLYVCVAAGSTATLLWQYKCRSVDTRCPDMAENSELLSSLISVYQCIVR